MIIINYDTIKILLMFIQYIYIYLKGIEFIEMFFYFQQLSSFNSAGNIYLYLEVTLHKLWHFYI